jgi:hapalindole biogenesis HpiC1 cyclase-like protein/PEP-CTERM motif-containing protein
MTKRVFHFCAVALLSATRMLTSNAAPITVPNFSFETPVLSSGGVTNGGNGDTIAITSWTISSTNTNNGVYHPAAGAFSSVDPLPAPADQNQVAYLIPDAESSSSITTTASVGTIAANTMYTLTVALGNRLDTSFFDSGLYTIDILANGVSVAEATRSGNTIAHGAFSDLSAIFTSSAAGPLIGQSLTLQLSASSGFGGNEAIFDNVRLTATVVPEPGMWEMILIGLVTLLGAQRLRRIRR